MMAATHKTPVLTDLTWPSVRASAASKIARLVEQRAIINDNSPSARGSSPSDARPKPSKSTSKAPAAKSTTI